VAPGRWTPAFAGVTEEAGETGETGETGITEAHIKSRNRLPEAASIAARRLRHLLGIA